MGTVSKALSLLSFYSRSRDLIGLSEMTRLSGMNKATVHRLMTELQNQGFVEQVGTGREYRLGPVFLRLASLREAAVPTRDMARKVLEDLSEATHETAHFSMLQGNNLTMVAYAYSPLHGTRVTMEDAEILALHATSSGLAVLAFSDQEFVDQVLAEPLEAFTPKTVTDRDQLRARLGPIRDARVAQSLGGFEDDVHSHAMPIFDAHQKCIGALAVAAPKVRVTDELQSTIKAALSHHAIRLTRLLGGFLPDGFQEKDTAA